MIDPTPVWERAVISTFVAPIVTYVTILVIKRYQERKVLKAFEGVLKKTQEVRKSLEDAIPRESFDLLVSSSPVVSPNASALMASNEFGILRQQIETLRLQVLENKNEIVEVQRIDPILEATLKLTVENLVKRIDLLETKVISKWDVALIVAQILGTLGALLGLTFAIIKYLHP
jgi:hypothetical protein